MIGYVFLALSIVASCVFAQSFRFSQIKHGNPMGVAAVNYVVAALAACGIYLSTDGAGENLNVFMAGLGTFTGTVYFVHLLVILASYRIAGVGITTSLISSGVIIPTIFAWLFWPDEQATMHHGFAIALVPASMLLMRPKNGGDKPKRLTFTADIILIAAFVLSGVTGITHSTVGRESAAIDGAAYRAALFMMAAILSVGYCVVKRIRPNKTDLIVGCMVGVCNVGIVSFLLIALSYLSNVIVWTTYGSVGICLNLAVAWLFWKERIARRQALGIALAIGVVILANWR